MVAILSPHHLALRLLAASSTYKRLQRRLQRVGPRVDRVEEVAAGLCCLVSVEGVWHRGRVEEREEGSCLVRLVDEARREVVGVAEVRKMPKQFVEEHAYCFMVHLPACVGVGVKEVLGGRREVEEVLGGRREVTVIRRGVPEQVCGAWSLPAELAWTEADHTDPVAPSVTRTAFLSQLLLAAAREKDVEVMREQEEVEEQDTLEEELSGTLGRSTEVAATFRWRDPVLPSTTTFLASCTFVDEVGQVYVQVEEAREECQQLRPRLEAAMERSLADCPREAFRPGQEVLARWWRDGRWYRARFLHHTPYSDHAEAQVLFVDFGNCDKVQTSELRCQLFATDLPILALRVVLADVAPLGAFWSPDTIDFVHDRLNGARRAEVRVVGGLDRQPLLASVLLAPVDEGAPWVHLSHLLVQRGGARAVLEGAVDTPQWRQEWAKFSWGVSFTRPACKPRAGPGRWGVAPAVWPAAAAVREGEVVEASVLGSAAWDRVVVRLHPSPRLRPGLAGLACYPAMAAALGRSCPTMPPLLGGGAGMVGGLAAVEMRGVWVRARLVGGGRMVLVDLGREEEVGDTRALRQLPEEWELTPPQVTTRLQSCIRQT